MFCPDCGTHLITDPTKLAAVIVKVGTLDDPAQFKPDLAIHMVDVQPYHHVDPALPRFERRPG